MPQLSRLRQGLSARQLHATVRAVETLETTQAGVDAVIAAVGKRISLATPLGIGKPNHLLNELYRRAKADPTLELVIHTALTLARPEPKSELERRLVEPIHERLFGGYPELEFERDRARDRLPRNVRVIEFYFQAGKYLHNRGAQRDYISSNYTHVARDLLARGINVIAQQVCAGVVDGRPLLSLSSNPDLTLDMARGLAAQRAAGRAVVNIAQINDSLPFMHGDALVPPDFFDYVVDDPSQYFRLFGPPKQAVSDADTMLGLYSSALVRDGGELQIGIGALGDALVYALLLRHREPARYAGALAATGMQARFGAELARIGQQTPFAKGLFAASEMLVDGFMELFKAGVLKRKVYDDMTLSRLLDEGRISERVQPELLDLLRVHKAITSPLGEADLQYLIHFGVLRPTLRWEAGYVVLPDGQRIVADLNEPVARKLLEAQLGERLKRGVVIQAGFFVGPEALYDWLRELPESERKLIDMRSVTRINQLYGAEEINRLHRRDARFINTTLKMTLLGAACSDALEDGSIVSGVGGQYNFVAMAHELPGGRSVLQLRSTRHAGERLESNLVWSYGQTTIPRHLRDLVITEYGVADLRGRTDQECVQALLNLCDSRFQASLQAEAVRAGKLDPSYRIPDQHRNNLPAAYTAPLAELRKQGLFPSYPFGCDLTPEERRLASALNGLARAIRRPRAALETLVAAAKANAPSPELTALLRRMQLEHPRTPRERVYRRLLLAALER